MSNWFIHPEEKWEKNYIPHNNNLRHDIVQSFHDHETAGHPGEIGTYNADMTTLLVAWTTNLCQKLHARMWYMSTIQDWLSPAKPVYIPTEGAKSLRPFDYCSMDLITNLPLADRHNSIQVMVDQGLSKGVILIPCNKTLTSEGTVWLLFKNLYKQFGLPDKIISDRGPQLASRAFFELLKLLGIKSALSSSALSTAYHPQTDGTTKWTNQEIEAYRLIYCASHPEDWPQVLHTLEFTHKIDDTQTG